MESTALPRTPALTLRVQLALIGALLLGAAAAWALTGDRMQGMDAGPGTDLGDLGWFLGVWVVMMAAMMLPSIAPMVLMHARVRFGAGEGDAAAPAGATALFVAGYLVTWTLAGIIGYAIFDLGASLNLEFLAWDEAGRYVAAGVILGAAVYQRTRPKDACLSRCREPHAFIRHDWRPGATGALRMGIDHGAWCVGCCWALMAALFALGVMSLGWMVLIAAFIGAEKLLPWKAVANRGVALALVVLAISVAAGPQDVPGLTVPGSPEATRAMEAMGMEGSMEDGSEAPASESMEGGGMKEEP